MSSLNRPIQYLGAMLNLPYIFLVTLGGSEESQRKRLINYGLTFAIILIILQLINAVDIQAWLLVGIVAFIFLYLRPKRLVGLLILIVAVVAFLVTLGAVKINIEYPWW